MKNSLIVFLVALLLSFLASPVEGAPVINNSSGNVIDGLSINISGSGFGTKTQAAPVVWDDFDGGSNGNDISGQNPAVGSSWGNLHGHSPVYASENNRASSSTLNAKLELSSSGSTGRTISQTGLSINEGSKLFLSFWLRFDWGTIGGGDTRQIKSWRIFWEGEQGEWNEFDRDYIYATNWTSPNPPFRSRLSCLYDGNSNTNRDIGVTSGSFKYLPDEKWLRHEVAIQVSSAPNTADGAVKYWLSQADFTGAIEKHIDHSDYIMIAASPNDDIWNSFFLGQWMGNTTEPFSTTLYYDDVYFDTSWQRVEIGDNATWADCTHREIQVPTAWSSSSITATVNQGSFKNGDSAYLFVVDGDGNVSNGYPITIGGNAPPSPPSGLQVVD